VSGRNGAGIWEYTKKVAEKWRKIEFKASNEWFESFHKIHQIAFIEVCGESNYANIETMEEWVAELPL
jgi:hypothetical protein